MGKAALILSSSVYGVCAYTAQQLLLIPFCVMGMVTVVSYGASNHQWNVTLAQVIHFASVKAPSYTVGMCH